MNINDKNEQTNVFVGMTNVLNEEQFMQEQIEAMTELKTIKLVNRMFIKLEYKGQLFNCLNQKERIQSNRECYMKHTGI